MRERATLWATQFGGGYSYARGIDAFVRRLSDDVHANRLRGRAAEILDTLDQRYDDELPWIVAEHVKKLFSPEN
jgi:hypothetical protein